jgi:hypothetical protein
LALNAGSAYSEYRLRYDGFLDDIKKVKAEYARLQADLEKGKPPSFGGGDTKGAKELAALAKIHATIAQQQARAAAAQTTAQNTAAVGAQRLAVAQNTAATSAQRLSTEQQKTVAATANAARAAAQAEAAQLRLAQAQERAAVSVKKNADGVAILPRTFAGLSDEAAAFASSLTGVGAALTALGAAGAIAAQGFQLKASIDAGRASLGAFLGSQERANETFAAGARFADQYAIKQSEVAGALAALAPLLRTSTTETEKQLEVMTRLQSLNPAATFNDAAFSIKELAGGDYASIVEQFNLSRTAAQRLRDEVAKGADVFQVLDAELNRMGATSAVLSTRLEGAAGAQNQYNAAVEKLQLSIGTLVTGPGTNLLNFLSEAITRTTLLTDRLSGQGNVYTQNAAAVVATSGSYASYTASLAAANAQTDLSIARGAQFYATLNTLLPGLGAVTQGLVRYTTQNQQLSESQYLYAQALMASGVAQEQAVAQAQAQSVALNQIQGAVDSAGGALDIYQQRLAAVATAGEGYTLAAVALVAQFDGTAEGAARLAAGLDALEDSALRNAQAATIQTNSNLEAAAASGDATAQYILQRQAIEGTTNASADATVAANQAALAKITDAAAADEARQRHEELEKAIIAAANGSNTVQASAANIAAAFRGTEIPAIIDAINYYRELQAARAGAARAETAKAALADQRAGERNLKIDVARAAAVEQYGQRQRAYNAEQAREAAARESKARKAKGGGGGGGSSAAATKAQKEAEQLAAQQQKYDDQRVALQEETTRKLQELEQEHGEKLLAIQATYLKKQAEAERSLRLTSLQSRASFYDQLTQSTPDIGQEQAQALSAAYEAAFQEAQALAQNGQAALAQDFLKLKQEQIAAELDYQKAVAAAKEKGDAAEVERLRRIEELNKAARDEELKQLLEGGDANQKAAEDAVATENQAYVDKQGEIASAAEVKADKITVAEAKILNATTATNLALAEQLRLQQAQAGLPQTSAPPLPQAQAVATANPAGASTLPTAGTGGAVLVDYPALFSQVVVLSGDIARIAGLVEVQGGKLDNLYTAQEGTARALERLGQRGT